LEGVLSFLLFPLQTLLMLSMKLVKCVFALAFRFGAQTMECQEMGHGLARPQRERR
jgi:hypothetical protein